MIRNAIRMAILAAAFILSLPAWADYETGQRAWDAGRLDEALTRWRAAASAGDRRAMLALGQRYLQGLGVLQDYVEAHMWFNLAASRGEAAAVSERDAVAAKMTPAQIAAAQQRAAAWRLGTSPGGSAPATPTPSAAVLASEEDSPPLRAIREAQRLLGALGYQPGVADGIWGARTAQAYRAFLINTGLPVVDILTPDALRALRAHAQQRDGVAAEDTRDTALRPDALHRATQAGDIDAVNAAIAAGTDVNARDARGWTALMHAANKGYTLLVPLLLEADAEVDIRAPDGATALFIAAVHGHSDVIALLIGAGADASLRGPKGKTPAEAVQARFGGLQKERRDIEPPEILALLEGKTVAYIEAERDARMERERLEREMPVGWRFKDCNGCPEMVVIPPGEFAMGSPSTEPGRYNNEEPVHHVTIRRRFAVGIYEVTRGEFRRFVEETGHSQGGGCKTYEGSLLFGSFEKRANRSWRNPGFSQGEREPVVCVNWHDAKSYVTWLSGTTGKAYRLLSESEWEYVARAGTTTPSYFGARPSSSQANNDGTDERTTPAGSYPPNGFGLYDVLGNVWEWVEDCWNRSYRGAPQDGSVWESGDCSQRVNRGGSWHSFARNLRSAGRDNSDAGERNDNTGFRVARTLKLAESDRSTN